MMAEKLAPWEITQEFPSSWLKPLKKQLQWASWEPHSIRQHDEDTRTINVKSASRQKTSSDTELHSDVSNPLHMNAYQNFTSQGTWEQDGRFSRRQENPARKSNINVINVAKSLVRAQPLFYIREFIVERSLMHVMSVQRLSAEVQF